MIPTTKTIRYDQKKSNRVKIEAIATLPTQFGKFFIIAISDQLEKKEHAVLLKKDVWNEENVPTRIHSECLTGDAFGSLKCDCREQLILSLKYLEKHGGILIYLRQEGRGIGFINKIKAYSLQDQGLDTVEANLALGFRSDLRKYDVAAEVLKILGVKSIQLLTNNPDKINQLKKLGITITNRIPLIAEPNEFNYRYLLVKKEKSGHFLDDLVLAPIMIEQHETIRWKKEENSKNRSD